MNSGHATFAATRQQTLTYRYFLPSSQVRQARAIVILLHGWGDHSGRYSEQAKALCANDYAVYAPDFYGHGLSPGPRAKVHNFQQLVDDLHAFVTHLSRANTNSGSGLFLCGHSMGGCLAFHYALQFPEQLAGIIFNSAALTINPKISTFKRWLARRLGRHLSNVPVSYLKFAEMMSQLPHEQQQYKDDKLIYHGKIDAGTGLALMEANDFVSFHMNLLVTPFLALQGTDDVLVNPEGPELLMQKSTTKDKTLHRFTSMRHELLHEPVKAEILLHINAWLNERTTASAFK